MTSAARLVIVVMALLASVLAAQQPAAQQPPQGPPPEGGFGPGGRQGGGRGRGVPIQPGEECPAGMTEVRPGSCQAPSFPAPSIVDYRPKSTLVSDVHMVPKAKFPVIDYHGHPGGGRISTPEGLAGLASDMDKLNIRVMVAADNTSGERLVAAANAVKGSPQKDRVRILTGINFNGVGPGWAEKAIAQLEADVKAGAVGVGEVSKAFGLRTQKPDGTRLKVDDPALDPIWDACGRLGLPVFIHTAEPQEFFEPIDMHNERWLELALFADRRNPSPPGPSFNDLMAERDTVFRRHPKTNFVAAHMGWYANDLGRLSKLLDAMPNVYTEVGAVLYDIGRQPRAAHDFFIKYQDRLLFGKDAYQPEEYPYYWRVFETKDDYFDYYRDYHAFWKLYGIDLPDQVLKKLYYQNALKITPGIPQTGWPK